ncbi:DUF3710 domain-containing protein [Corynebacterium uterequi]|uniref:Putative DUF3710 family protein n=1 Tax=Corynebacterium uterequi TaxID=1072256 RepID=A0A0G3HD80_9CORY|nr:DUF3710 domain-containing protein [Corynebacterium uterequi]AKK11259.1 putative DUF3710 family protein [Corynebacterium uterequi]
MAVWPFGRKKKDNEDTEQQLNDVAHAASPAEEAASATPGSEPNPPSHGDDLVASLPHDAVNGDSGPFDGDQVDIEDFDFSDYSIGTLNLGSMRIPMPSGLQVQVELGPSGPKMIHLVNEHCRITPLVFAAPASGGQWESASADILAGMKRDGVSDAVYEAGPWGREILGTVGANTVRVIGVDGPRWMLRFMVVSPAASQDAARDTAHALASHTFVYRGTQPMLAGNSLPVAVPQQLVNQVNKAISQHAKQQAAQRAAQQTTRMEHDEQSIAEAAEALRSLRDDQPAAHPKTDSYDNTEGSTRE